MTGVVENVPCCGKLLEFNLLGVNKGNKEGLCLVPKKHATTNRNLLRQFFNYSKTKGELNIMSGSSVRIGIRCTFLTECLRTGKTAKSLVALCVLNWL